MKPQTEADHVRRGLAIAVTVLAFVWFTFPPVVLWLTTR